MSDVAITDHEAEQFEMYLREKGIVPHLVAAMPGADRLANLKKVLAILIKILPLFLGEAHVAATSPGVVGAPKINWQTLKRLLDISPEVFSKVQELIALIRGAIDSPEFAG